MPVPNLTSKYGIKENTQAGASSGVPDLLSKYNKTTEQVATPPVITQPVQTDPLVPKTGYLGRGRDFLLSAAQGAYAVPGALTGMADTYVGGAVGKKSEELQKKYLGSSFKDMDEYIQGMKSPEQQAVDKGLRETKGFLPTVTYMAKNPSTITSAIGQSGPSIITGGLLARVLGAVKYGSKIPGYLRGAIGEGAISGGLTAEQARSESSDGLLTGRQQAVSAISAILTGGLGVLGGKVAQRLGIADIDTIMAGGPALIPKKKSIIVAALKGALAESVFEELPQSMQEQIASNINAGRPWDEGVAEAGAQGMMTAFPLGGTVSGGRQALDNRVAGSEERKKEEEKQNRPFVEQPILEPKEEFVPGEEPVYPEEVPTPPPIIPEVPVEEPVIPEAPPVVETPAPVTKTPSGDTLTVKPATTDLPYMLDEDGRAQYFPKPLVSKSDVKSMMQAMGGDVTFTVTEKDGNKYFSYTNEDGTKTIDIRPQALGLVEENLQVGNTIELKKSDFKTAGSTYRAYDDDGNIVASRSPAYRVGQGIKYTDGTGQVRVGIVREIKEADKNKVGQNVPKRMVVDFDDRLLFGRSIPVDSKNIKSHTLSNAELAAVSKTKKEDEDNKKKLFTNKSKMRQQTEDIENNRDVSGYVPAKTTAQLKEKVNQINKLAQTWSLKRKMGNLGKGIAGSFSSGLGKPKKGQVNINKETTISPKQYMSTLAHEVAHAMDFLVNGTTGSKIMNMFGEDLTQEQKTVIMDELRKVTNALVGEAVALSDPSYYYSKAELFARFMETMMIDHNKLAEMAPNAYKGYGLMSIKHPKMSEYMDAVLGTIDKNQFKFVLFRDMRQTYHKFLGQRVGNIAYNMELRYRNMKARSMEGITKMINDRFEGVKDDPELIFDVLEATLSYVNGIFKFGTRDIQYAENDAEVIKLLNAGYEQIPGYKIVDGESYTRFAKQRWTEEQGQLMYNQLSPEGKKLVQDFTKAKEERTDGFNREFLKELYKVNSDVEGWVHRMYETNEDEVGIGTLEKSSDKFKFKTASARKGRSIDSGEKPGLIKDARLSLIKGVTELQIEKDFNTFIEDYFYTVSKLIPEGEKAEKGFTTVYGKVEKGGIGSWSEVPKQTLINETTGKRFNPEIPRYQVPTEIYRRFKLINEVVEETADVVKLFNTLNRYWRINILTHPGSTATNAISGGLQFSGKFINDMWLDVLTFDASLAQTRRNIAAVLTTMTPKGWKATGDWTYGGDSSNFYSEFQSKKSPGMKLNNKNLDKAVDVYGDKALKLFGMVERYWKKVIAKSEGADQLGHLGIFGKDGFDIPTEMENAMLDLINSEVDMWGLDYDNVPSAIDDFNKGAFTSAIKPFVKYPYKIFKTFSAMLTRPLDRTLSPQERMAAALTLGTMMVILSMAMKSRDDEEETPEVSEDAPSSVDKRGRVLVGKYGKEEKYLKVTKYPFLNIREAVSGLNKKDYEAAGDVLKEMIGGVGPVGEIGAAIMGYKNEYNTYMPTSVIIGKSLSSFVPLSRILADAARLTDPYKRRQETFADPFTSLIPLPGASKELLEEFRGKARTIDIPLEGNIRKLPGDTKGRTTTTKYVRENPNDILWSLFAGVNVKSINPEEAKAFAIREKENAKKAVEKAKKEKQKVIH
jgi:hypothetical protein